jgi:tRNA-dihydrouridine synthase B
LNKFSDYISNNFLLALAPMEDITDSAFRQVCKSFGADLLVTEFIAADGLIREAEKSRRKLNFIETERPLGIQIFGNNVDSVVAAVKIAEEAGPDFIDLNFGCPVKKVVDKGGGAALLKDIPKMIHITTEVVKSTHIPVTVKTRLGWDEKSIVIHDLAEQLQDVGIVLLTIHGRTKAQMYKGEANWIPIGEVKNNPRIHIPIIGNGDIDSPEIALVVKNKYGVNGIMIGRAAIGNPWIFRDIKEYLNSGNKPQPVSIRERIEVVTRQITRSINNKGERLAILETRKHYSGIFRALPDFKPFRMKLVVAENKEEVFNIFNEIENFYSSEDLQ